MEFTNPLTPEETELIRHLAENVIVIGLWADRSLFQDEVTKQEITLAVEYAFRNYLVRQHNLPRQLRGQHFFYPNIEQDIVQILTRPGYSSSNIKRGVAYWQNAIGLSPENRRELFKIAEHFQDDFLDYLYGNLNFRDGAGGHHNEARRSTSVILQTTSSLEDNIVLTPKTLESQITPILWAIEELQGILHYISPEVDPVVKINLISQNSPVSVNFTGGEAAIGILDEAMNPERRDLETERRYLENEKLKVELLEAQARASKVQGEAQILLVDAQRKRLENEKIAIENLEKRIQLASQIVDSRDPNLSSEKRIVSISRMMEVIDRYLGSDYRITSRYRLE